MTINLKQRLFTSFLLFLLIVLIAYSSFFLVFSLLILGVLSIIEFSTLLKKIDLKLLMTLILNTFFVIYIFIFCFLFFFFSNFLHLKILLLSILVGCASSDIGGYITGKIIKGPKLTKISPNKTISGSVGSIFMTMIILSILIFYFTETFNIKILFVAIITSLACQFGDLFFSLLKRKAKVKDTGNFFPGHGGVLDRLDGILLGLPLGLLSFVVFFK